MQTTAIGTVANSLPENEVILLTLLISKGYILFAELPNNSGNAKSWEQGLPAVFRRRKGAAGVLAHVGSQRCFREGVGLRAFARPYRVPAHDASEVPGCMRWPVPDARLTVGSGVRAPLPAARLVASEDAKKARNGALRAVSVPGEPTAGFPLPLRGMC